jgi:hypothetical protein
MGGDKCLTKEFTIGMVSYFYQQLTPDSGSGARLGAFEGRAVALGGTRGYTFEIGKTPVSTRLKVYRRAEPHGRNGRLPHRGFPALARHQQPGCRSEVDQNKILTTWRLRHAPADLCE